MSQEIKPALVVIDMEEGFLNENSPLYLSLIHIYHHRIYGFHAGI